MKAVPAAIMGLALTLPCLASAWAQNPAAAALGAPAQPKVASPPAAPTVKPGSGGGATSTPTATGDLAAAIKDGDTLQIIMNGGTARDAAKSYCDALGGPGCVRDGQAPLDLSTARFVSARPGQFWNQGCWNGVRQLAAMIAVTDANGATRYLSFTTRTGSTTALNRGILSPLLRPNVAPISAAAPRDLGTYGVDDPACIVAGGPGAP